MYFAEDCAASDMRSVVWEYSQIVFKKNWYMGGSYQLVWIRELQCTNILKCTSCAVGGIEGFLLLFRM